MLPAVLACYEVWIGQRRWKRLVPFFAVSLLFGIQAAILPVHRGTRYEMQLGLNSLATTICFYSSQLFLLPYAGLLLLALPFFVRDRRLWLGLAAMLLLLIPRFWQRGVAVSYYMQNMVEPITVQPFAPPSPVAPVLIQPVAAPVIPSAPPEPSGS